MTLLTGWAQDQTLKRKADRADDLDTALDLEKRARQAEGQANEEALDNPGGDGIVDRLRNDGQL
ncbi:hypothetical protein [Cohaesibacter celericrescens]|uniref:hypothetical protein n=1 Tax=Cohaesibacter celericrescens TaxID=2067669 RepID=UPI0011AFAADA|nr:hypothetical protein [Cohaesibacter celericrescens]